jgi:lipopolysaccharide transport system ATP-binding protein
MVISVESLGKKYRLRHQVQGRRYVALRDVIAYRAKSLFRAPARALRRLQTPSPFSASASCQSTLDTRHSIEDFWALKDVSFEVKQGEVVGIIGRNGAGKSTLLKILSRITEPTEGRIRLRGRVASLLEVGTGFHPELTGRENIFLNGAILGMTRDEIRRKFDEIVAFAEVEKFLDTPVKRYSSGMYVRLAFAVAANLEPEILIIDEVLAVGDAEFQKKCLGKMDQVARHEGRTVLFVSHNMPAVKRLCTRCVWLDSGSVRQIASPHETINSYLNANLGFEGEIRWPKRSHAPGSNSFAVRAFRILNSLGKAATRIESSSAITIEIDYEILEPMAPFRICVQVMTSDGTTVLQTCDNAVDSWPSKRRVPGTYTSRCHIPANLLNTQQFYLTMSADVPHELIYFVNVQTLSFEVVHATNSGGRMGDRGEAWPGAINPPIEWKIEEKPS